MKESEITALAREFSKEHDDSTIAYHAAKDVINFLLCRYCLVEKAKVIETYNRIWNEWNFTLDAENKANSKFLLSALESLFPEIAKEAES